MRDYVARLGRRIPGEPLPEPTPCSHCGSRGHLPISIICEDCQRPLLRVKWWWFIPFVGMLFAAGFVIGHSHYLWIANILLDLLIVTYILVLLRLTVKERHLSLFLMVISFPGILIVLYWHDFVPFQSVSGLPDPRGILLLLAGSLASGYLLYNYLRSWTTACREAGTTWAKGLPALTFTFYLLLLVLDLANSYLNLLGDDAISFLRNQLHLRTILLVVILIHTLAVAYVSSASKSIKRPENVIRQLPIQVELRRSSTVPNALVAFVVRIALTLYNAMLLLYKHTAQTARAPLDVTKAISTYAIRLFANYVRELVKVSAALVTVFLITNLRWLRHHALPLFVLYAIALALYDVLQTISRYVNEGTIEFQRLALGILSGCGVFVGVVIFAWTTTRFAFGRVLMSVSVSNTYFAFTLSYPLCSLRWAFGSSHSF